MNRRAITSIVAASVAVGFAACSTSDVTGVRATSAARDNLAGVGSTLVECPTSTTTSASGLVTPLGAVVSAGGTSIVVPEGAVLVPTTITVTVPASNYMEVDVSVSGSDHFTFQMPVTIAIGYGRCTRADIDKSPLTAWYIDSQTKALLTPMSGVDDKTARTVTFTTGHLSGYALAN